VAGKGSNFNNDRGEKPGRNAPSPEKKEKPEKKTRKDGGERYKTILSQVGGVRGTWKKCPKKTPKRKNEKKNSQKKLCNLAANLT